MKYKCFCFVENIEDLTKEELSTMLRKSKRFRPEEFIEYYKITATFYIDLLRSKGLSATRMDRIPLAVENKRKRDESDNKRNVSYEGKDNYYSDLKPIELVAMRMFRGYDRSRFSKISTLKKYEIEMYESGRIEIPKIVSEEYKQILQIQERHIIQLKEIISGDSKTIIDNRQIPTVIKLKVWTNYKGKCAHCESTDKLHYHHIKHFSKGGRHTEDNLKLLCVDCHADEHKGETAYNLIKSMR